MRSSTHKIPSNQRRQVRTNKKHKTQHLEKFHINDELVCGLIKRHTQKQNLPELKLIKAGLVRSCVKTGFHSFGTQCLHRHHHHAVICLTGAEWQDFLSIFSSARCCCVLIIHNSIKVGLAWCSFFRHDFRLSSLHHFEIFQDSTELLSLPIASLACSRMNQKSSEKLFHAFPIANNF